MENMDGFILYLTVFIFGVCTGSFLNVCILRIPKKESVVRNGSRCVSCGGKIKPWDMIPVLSWFILRGKCRSCGERFSFRYPFVELLAGAGFAGLYLFYGQEIDFIFAVLLFSALTAVFFIDLEHRIIPDRINIFLLITGTLYNMVRLFVSQFDFGVLVTPAIGFFAASVPLLLLALLSRGGMGGGDIKLMAVCGLFLGWKNIILAMFMGAFIALLSYIAVAAVKRGKRGKMIPFGPFLSVGVMVSLLYGDVIVDAYIKMVMGQTL